MVILWDAASGNKTATFDGNIKDRVDNLAISPDGKILVAGLHIGSGRIIYQLWNVSTGKISSTLNASGDIFAPMAFSPDGKTLALVGDNNTIDLWAIKTDQ
jgi:WD40 repeat protein